MTFLGAALIALLIAGYPLHRAVVRANEAVEREAEACTDVLGLLAGLEVERARFCAALAKSIRSTERAMDDVSTLGGKLAHANLAADIHAERHTCLPTLDGIRAGGRGVGVVVDFPARGRG